MPLDFSRSAGSDAKQALAMHNHLAGFQFEELVGYWDVTVALRPYDSTEMPSCLVLGVDVGVSIPQA